MVTALSEREKKHSTLKDDCKGTLWCKCWSPEDDRSYLYRLKEEGKHQAGVCTCGGVLVDEDRTLERTHRWQHPEHGKDGQERRGGKKTMADGSKGSDKALKRNRRGPMWARPPDTHCTSVAL